MEARHLMLRKILDCSFAHLLEPNRLTEFLDLVTSSERCRTTPVDSQPTTSCSSKLVAGLIALCPISSTTSLSASSDEKLTAVLHPAWVSMSLHASYAASTSLRHSCDLLEAHLLACLQASAQSTMPSSSDLLQPGDFNLDISIDNKHRNRRRFSFENI